MKFLGTEPTVTELPTAVLMLLCIAALNLDVDSQHRGWGQQYLGEGVTVGDTHYSTSEARLTNPAGETVMGVTLTIRERFWTNALEKPYTSYTYPLADLRRLAVELPLAVTE